MAWDVSPVVELPPATESTTVVEHPEESEESLETEWATRVPVSLPSSSSPPPRQRRVRPSSAGTPTHPPNVTVHRGSAPPMPEPGSGSVRIEQAVQTMPMREMRASIPAGALDDSFADLALAIAASETEILRTARRALHIEQPSDPETQLEDVQGGGRGDAMTLVAEGMTAVRVFVDELANKVLVLENLARRTEFLSRQLEAEKAECELRVQQVREQWERARQRLAEEQGKNMALLERLESINNEMARLRPDAIGVRTGGGTDEGSGSVEQERERRISAERMLAEERERHKNVVANLSRENEELRQERANLQAAVYRLNREAEDLVRSHEEIHREITNAASPSFQSGEQRRESGATVTGVLTSTLPSLAEQESVMEEGESAQENMLAGLTPSQRRTSSASVSGVMGARGGLLPPLQRPVAPETRLELKRALEEAAHLNVLLQQQAEEIRALNLENGQYERRMGELERQNAELLRRVQQAAEGALQQTEQMQQMQEQMERESQEAHVLQLEEAAGQIEEMRRQLATARERAEGAEGRIEEMQRELAAAQERAEGAEGRIEEMRRQLAAAQERARGVQQEAERLTEEMQRRLAAAQERAERAEGRIEEMRRQLAAAQERARGMQQERGRLEEETTPRRLPPPTPSSPPSLRQGTPERPREEMADWTTPPGVTPGRVTHILQRRQMGWRIPSPLQRPIGQAIGLAHAHIARAIRELRDRLLTDIPRIFERDTLGGDLVRSGLELEMFKQLWPETPPFLRLPRGGSTDEFFESLQEAIRFGAPNANNWGEGRGVSEDGLVILLFRFSVFGIVSPELERMDDALLQAVQDHATVNSTIRTVMPLLSCFLALNPGKKPNLRPLVEHAAGLLRGRRFMGAFTIAKLLEMVAEAADLQSPGITQTLVDEIVQTAIPDIVREQITPLLNTAAKDVARSFTVQAPSPPQPRTPVREERRSV